MRVRDLDLVAIDNDDIVTVRGNWDGDFIGRLTYVPDPCGPLYLGKVRYAKVMYPHYRGPTLRRRVVNFPSEEMDIYSQNEISAIYRPEDAFENLSWRERRLMRPVLKASRAEGIPVEKLGLTGSSAVPRFRTRQSDFDWVVYGRENVEASRRVVNNFGRLTVDEKMPTPSLLEKKYDRLISLSRDGLRHIFDTQWSYLVVKGRRMSLQFVDPDQNPPDIRISDELFEGDAVIIDTSLSYFSPRIYHVEAKGIEGMVSWLFLLRQAFNEGDKLHVKGRCCLVDGVPFVSVGQWGDSIEILEK